MQFVTDPAIATKIQRMQQRVRWQDKSIVQRGIDQTRLVLADQAADSPEFSFLVLGDSGSGYHRGHSPQRQIAEQMLEHRADCRFVLHTGDVVYLVGSKEFYPKNFIAPYREFLVGGENYSAIAYDQMVFNQPFFPVPGNHDYYDLPVVLGLLAQASLPLRYLLRRQVDIDVGLHGSDQGNAYAAAFLDYLKNIRSPAVLDRHLDQHYTATDQTHRCLNYRPGVFTRLPNRYYSFRAGGIDFFAIDSNTLNAIDPIPKTEGGSDVRLKLEQQQADIEREQRELLGRAALLNPQKTDQAEQLDDIHAKLEQLAEVSRDIHKQLTASGPTTVDREQLTWLQQRLIESWQTEAVRGRVLFFHHPPYVTEATKWNQAQTLAIRERLRVVLDAVAETVGAQAGDRPIVDLIINGHAHCFEYLRTTDTGHGDANTNWVVCGGSGYSLRRQRKEGPDLVELRAGAPRVVAQTCCYIGRSGQGSQKRRPYSFVRIDVAPGTPPKFVIRPYVSEWFHHAWHTYAAEPIPINH